MDHREQTPEQERYINFYGVPPCGHFLLFLPASQANEQHFCYSCQKTVAMESDAQHLQHVRQAEQERQARIQACAAELAAQPEDRDTCNQDGCINPCKPGYYVCQEHFDAMQAEAATQTSPQERLTTLAMEIQQHCFDYFDGKLTPTEWLTLVVDAVQQHQAEQRHEAKEQRLANLAEQERMAQEWRSRPEYAEAKKAEEQLKASEVQG